MQDILAVTYLWLKAGHIIFVVFWMAGLFMLPRQMIYVHPSASGSEERPYGSSEWDCCARLS